MEDQDSNSAYNNVVDKLLDTFGEILSRDVIFAIVESYEGDLDGSANAIINITMDENGVLPITTRNDLSPLHTNIKMDGNCTTPISPGNNLRTNNIHINQPGVSQPQMRHFYPQQDYCPPTLNSPPIKQPTMSYADAYQTNQVMKPALRPILKTEKVKQKPILKNDRKIEFLSSATNHKLKNIYKNHENGWRTLIILRGAPGSGKSFLARNIIDAMYNKSNNNYKMHIFGTDQYFMKKGVYEYCKFKLSEAHQWNQRCAQIAMKQGVSPVIIDNTNIEIWEMKPYVESGVNNGYIIEVVEPDTPWAKKAQILCNKNSHNVPYTSIRRMLDNYEPNVTGDSLLCSFGYNYLPDRTPPVLRSLPPFCARLPEESSSANCNKNYILNDGVKNAVTNNLNSKQHLQNCKTLLPNTSNTSTNTEGANDSKIESPSAKSPHTSLVGLYVVKEDQQKYAFSIPSPLIDSIEHNQQNASAEASIQNDQGLHTSIEKEIEKNLKIEEVNDLIQLDEVHDNLEVFEKVELAWEGGEKWEDADTTKVDEIPNSQGATLCDAKPQRPNKVTKSQSADNVLDSVIKNNEDWSTLCMFLPPWADENKTQNLPDLKHSKPEVEKKTSHTCIEIGDTNICSTKNPYKIILAVPRDINEFHLPITDIKIPDQWMLHKSTSTHDNLILTTTRRCKNEEQHFEVLVKWFKNIDKSVLRDIFDKCGGDVNWTVDIVLDDVGSENSNIIDDINSPNPDTDIPVFDCECLSAYNLTPHRLETALPETSIQKETQSPINLKKAKKEIVPSEASIELKRQIEENIVIPDNHYSEHYLKLRKYRRGEIDTPENVDTEKRNMESESSDPIETLKAEHQNTAQLDCYLPSTSKMGNGVPETSDTDSCESVDGDVETVNVTIGKELILKLNEVYGGRTAELLDIIKPTINIPMFLLNEINALWVESVAHQIEENSKQSELMLIQDEELARQLAFKEEELSLAGKEPEIPDFKEIMDMDFALSLYQKDVDEWRNNLPDDLAAKLSREKLYNLFPSISPDVLSELLLAHDNNFQATVEVLLTSTGQSDILNTKNGVNKFVMEKEMERQEKLLQEEKDALSEVEWPLLPKSDMVDMAMVQKYRDEADKHLKFRNLNFHKAQDYIKRGMTQVGSYFSDVAAFHKMSFEQANSRAAASLMQVHAANATDLFTLDLHFLRVGEAKEAVDLFLDSHIQKLRELNIRSNKYHSLFFITGRGLHSHGRPKLKPAVKKRLQERGLFCGERNPGLIATRICASNALSYQIA